MPRPKSGPKKGPKSKPRRPPGKSRTDAGKPPRRHPSQRPGAAPAAESTGEQGERLQKVLAAAGLASRRECEELIREGRVEVDHQVVTELGTRVDPQRQEVRVDGEVLHQPKPVYLAVNKPEGIVSTSRDPAGRTRVIDLLPPNTPRAYCVGRLDMSSEGLILVTNDGELANGLTHPRHGVEKIYQVQVAGEVPPNVVQQLERGVRLAEGFAHAKHVRIKSRRRNSTLLEMVLDEGRNREIRRMLARAGHRVQRLMRIAVGPVRLGDLPSGAVRPLTRTEVRALKLAVATGRQDEEPSDADAASDVSPRRGPRRESAAPRTRAGKRPAGRRPRKSSDRQSGSGKSGPGKSVRGKSGPGKSNRKSTRDRGQTR